MTSVHGDVSVNWFDNVCVSTLRGAFNEEGITNWFLRLQQSWVELGKPERWAHVLDMYGWQGRTPETTHLVRKGVAWANGHGLSYSVIIMDQGPASIFIKINQTSNPVIPADDDITICQNYEEAVTQLQRRQFAIVLQQLRANDSPSLQHHPTHDSINHKKSSELN